MWEHCRKHPDLTDPAGIRLNPIGNQGGEREKAHRKEEALGDGCSRWQQTMQIGSQAADAGGSLNWVRRAAEQRRKGRAANEGQEREEWEDGKSHKRR